MGLFDKFKKPSLDASEIVFTDSGQALAMLLYAVACTDESLDDDEVGAVAALIHFNGQISGVEPDIDYKYITLCVDSVGPEAAIRAAFDYLPLELHEPAFTYACMVAMADGHVSDEEAAILIEIAKMSDEFDLERAEQLIDMAGVVMSPMF
ncbi:MAG: hypothetical protein AXW15_02270 [Neptuniibacter sp. Phe_28]|jgi:prepilin-type processing-associated H-X9-DG protein|nr:MAG: hypothetical protein AXW15_02270 [Neptuniibacter sp. Phe_28]